jgi:hypothetical protein
VALMLYLRIVRAVRGRIAFGRQLSADFAEDADFLNLNRRNRRHQRISFPA